MLEAEGDKRSAELESEGQKIRMKNESEGNTEEMNEATSNMTISRIICIIHT